MSPTILNGKEVAKRFRGELVSRIQEEGLAPHLCILQVGDDPASTRYIRQKKRVAALLGITVTHEHCPLEIGKEALLELIEQYNTNPEIHGLIIQAPLPPHLSFPELVTHIAPHKDVDGLHPFNQGGIRSHTHFFAPCTPRGIVELLKSYTIPLEGAHVGIINRSIIVGRPLTDLLLNENATVSVFHSHTTHLSTLTAQCDIVIAAVGKAHFLTPAYVKAGAVLVDVGCTLVDEQLVGDVDPACYEKVSAYTPVPGGVGPLTVTFLLANVVDAASRAA